MKNNRDPLQWLPRYEEVLHPRSDFEKRIISPGCFVLEGDTLSIKSKKSRPSEKVHLPPIQTRGTKEPREIKSFQTRKL